MIFKTAQLGLPTPLPGDHQNLVSLTYVKNVTEGMCIAMTDENAIGQTYFLSDSRPYRVEEIITAICSATNIVQPRRYMPSLPMWILASIGDAMGNIIRKDFLLSRREVFG